MSGAAGEAHHRCGGYVGNEVARAFRRRRSQVTILETGPRIRPMRRHDCVRSGWGFGSIEANEAAERCARIWVGQPGDKRIDRLRHGLTACGLADTLACHIPTGKAAFIRRTMRAELPRGVVDLS